MDPPKFRSPDHAARVAQAFYLLPELPAGMRTAVGVAQLTVVPSFVAGFQKRLSYGAILAMHTVSTLDTWEHWLNPCEVPNLLFFAAWPMLAACAALYLLRDDDVIASVEAWRAG